MSVEDTEIGHCFRDYCLLCALLNVHNVLSFASYIAYIIIYTNSRTGPLTTPYRMQVAYYGPVC